MILSQSNILWPVNTSTICGLRILYLNLLDITSGGVYNHLLITLAILNHTNQSLLLVWATPEELPWPTTVSNSCDELLLQTAVIDSYSETAITTCSSRLLPPDLFWWTIASLLWWAALADCSHPTCLDELIFQTAAWSILISFYSLGDPLLVYFVAMIYAFLQTVA
jgi:hypothetical protein